MSAAHRKQLAMWSLTIPTASMNALSAIRRGRIGRLAANKLIVRGIVARLWRRWAQKEHSATERDGYGRSEPRTLLRALVEPGLGLRKNGPQPPEASAERRILRA
jgi:hypothetical protein